MPGSSAMIERVAAGVGRGVRDETYGLVRRGGRGERITDGSRHAGRRDREQTGMDQGRAEDRAGLGRRVTGKESGGAGVLGGQHLLASEAATRPGQDDRPRRQGAVAL